MRISSIFAPAILASALLAPVAAQAQSQSCGPRELVTERLSLTYGEVFSGGGLQSDRAVFEIWVSEADGTWTILMTQADGMSCVMAAGTDWLPGMAAQLAGVPS